MSVKPITPSPINISDVTAGIDLGLSLALQQAEVEFAKSYHNWDNPPEWDTKGPQTRNGSREITYVTEDTPYVWVDNGTEPHEIEGNPFLRFATNSVPKTKPGALMSSSGFKGSHFVGAKKVKNPGIEARDFSGEVVKEIEPGLSDLVQVGIDKTSTI